MPCFRRPVLQRKLLRLRGDLEGALRKNGHRFQANIRSARTSPAETIVVTPPCRQLDPAELVAGVQSPQTGCTWLSISPGASVPGIDRNGGTSGVDVFFPADELHQPPQTVSASRMGRSRSPLRRIPIFRISSCWALRTLAEATSLMSILEDKGSNSQIIRDASLPLKPRDALLVGSGRVSRCSREGRTSI